MTKSNAKQCAKCKKIKAFGEFGKRSKAKDGLQSWCKMCMNNNTRQYTANRRDADPTYSRIANLKHTYGITLEDFDEMLESQGNKCAICRREDQKWHVDHDHSCCPGQKTCGKCVRAILCNKCNLALGGFQDSPENLRRAAEYLERFKEVA